MKINLLGIFSRITKKIPYFKGYGIFIKFINNFFLNIGVDPIKVSYFKDGTKLIIDLRSFAFYSFYFGEYNNNYIKIIKKLLSDNSVFVDVGSNVGFYCIAIARHFEINNYSSKVYAFEPLEANYNVLNKNIKNNSLIKYCKTYKLGLSDEKGQRNLTLRWDISTGANTGNASIESSKEHDKGYKMEKINIDKFDNIWPALNEDKYLKVIKLDIEGHEDFFLRGAKNVLDKYKPIIFMEVNKLFYSKRGVDINEVFEKSVPSDYLILRFCRKSQNWIETDIENCLKVDDVFLIHINQFSKYKKIFNLK